MKKSKLSTESTLKALFPNSSHRQLYCLPFYVLCHVTYSLASSHVIPYFTGTSF